MDPTLFERKGSASEEGTLQKDKKEATPEDTLKLNEPLAFQKGEKHSFTEWLKLSQAKPIKREVVSEENSAKDQEDKERKFELIEKFIQNPPKIQPTESSEKKKNLAKPFTKPSDSLMTETLAKVYLQQKNYKKAIQAYKILILKNPEKSGFFADQIRAIEKLINKES